MYCKDCGKQIADGSTFCTYCGAAQVPQQNPNEQKAHPRILNTNGIRERSIVTCILLTVLTCGFYGIYWFIRINDEMNQVSCMDGISGGLAFVLNLVTCGIYGLFWAYQMGEKRDYVANERADSRFIYLALMFFGLGIVAYALMQDTINKTLADTGI